MNPCIIEDASGHLIRYEPDGFGSWDVTNLRTGTRLMLVPAQAVEAARKTAARVYDEVKL